MSAEGIENFKRGAKASNRRDGPASLRRWRGWANPEGGHIARRSPSPDGAATTAQPARKETPSRTTHATVDGMATFPSVDMSTDPKVLLQTFTPNSCVASVGRYPGGR